MDLSTPVLLIHFGFLLVHALPNVVSENIYSTAGFSSVCGVIIIAEIVKFVGRGKTETSPVVRKLNNFLVQTSVASVSNCVWIAHKIALYVTCGRCT